MRTLGRECTESGDSMTSSGETKIGRRIKKANPGTQALAEIRGNRHFGKNAHQKAVKTLAAIMNEPHAPYAARVAAAEALLDRGWGKPRQSHEAEITHRYVIEIPALMDNAAWEAEALEPRKVQ